MRDVIAGFDIGGTKIALVVVGASGTPVHRSVESTDASSDAIDSTEDAVIYHGLADQLRRMLDAALDGVSRPRLRAIGIVSAGPIRGGGLRNPPNIVPTRIADAHRDLPRLIPLVDPLRDAFSCPVNLLNDCNGAALGEVYYGLGLHTADKSTLHLAYVTISTGFGVGAWDGGRLILGKDGNAGELGHTVVRPNGLPCGCGNRGCAEAYASGSGIVTNATERLLALGPAEQRSSILLRLLRERSPTGSSDAEALPRRLSPPIVFDAAAEHDPIAEVVLDDAVFAAGVAFSAVANAYDPAVISVGGAIALAHPELLEPIREEMLRHINVAPPEVRLTPLGARVTERGAVALARRLMDDDPSAGRI